MGYTIVMDGSRIVIRIFVRYIEFLYGAIAILVSKRRGEFP